MKKKINGYKSETGMAAIDPALERRKRKQLGVLSVSWYLATRPTHAHKLCCCNKRTCVIMLKKLTADCGEETGMVFRYERINAAAVEPKLMQDRSLM